MHLAQLHSPQAPKESPSFISSTLTSASSAMVKNMFAAFLVGTLLGFVVASSFFSVSPHQFHADVQISHVEELTSKLMNLPPSRQTHGSRNVHHLQSFQALLFPSQNL